MKVGLGLGAPYEGCVLPGSTREIYSRDIRRDRLEVELRRAKVVGLAAVRAASEDEGDIRLALVARSERGGDGAELTCDDDVGSDADDDV